jgi:hypothetical protein
LLAEAGALTERSPVRLLADEPDPGGPELERQALESLGAPREVGAAKVGRARRRAVGGVRDPDAVVEGFPLLVRVELAWREADGVQQPPEVVPRVREVRRGGGGNAAGIDTAEDDAQLAPEHVGNGAFRRVHSVSRVSPLGGMRVPYANGTRTLVTHGDEIVPSS